MNDLVTTCLKPSVTCGDRRRYVCCKESHLGVYCLSDTNEIQLPSKQCGITLLELVFTLAIAAIIMTALSGMVNVALNSEDDVREQNDLTQQARFAMQRMVAAVQGTRRLILPLADNPATDWREHVREQTVPASPPEGSSTLATAVLVVTLDPTIDRDGDGWADANNDKDYLDINNNGSRDAGEPERIDEDIGRDNNNDNLSGIGQVDDDGDGSVDEDGNNNDNDEDGVQTEDALDEIDNDMDGSEGEDASDDANGDGAPGIVGIDDDMDGVVDDGHNADDDEDGSRDEDWFDAVVYYLSGTSLMERMPDINPVDGADYSAQIIAENVSQFRVERIPQSSNRAILVDLTLELTGADGEIISLNSRIRVGGGL